MKTTIQATAPLKGFPTEKTLKDLNPTRGMVITTSINVPPGDRSVLLQMEVGSFDDPQVWKGGKVLVDAAPIFERIAEEMGYDPKLLAAGEGETGVPEHSWNTYADADACPLLVRWEAGAARLLLCVGLPMLTGRIVFQPTREAYVILLGNQEASDIMKRVGLALEGLADGLKPCEAEVAVGNAADPEVLAAANLPAARRLFCTLPEVFEAGQVVEQARAANPRLEIMARAHSDEAVAHLESHGANPTVLGEREIALRMLEKAGAQPA
jgi:voltage-gated potassium channel Kch